MGQWFHPMMMPLALIQGVVQHDPQAQAALQGLPPPVMLPGS
jgi:hypothetical protein